MAVCIIDPFSKSQVIGFAMLTLCALCSMNIQLYSRTQASRSVISASGFSFSLEFKSLPGRLPK